jgi:hypothetical protein
MSDEPKIIPVVCPDAFERYANRKVAFSVVLHGENRSYVGEFFIEFNPVRVSIRIVPDLFGNLYSSQYIRLSQEAVDSIRPIENEVFDFVVTQQLNRCLFWVDEKK